MRIVSKSMGIVAVALSVAGCSSYSTAAVHSPPIAPLGPAREDVATVCLYRPTNVGAALTIPVRDNGQLVGVTRAFSYFCWYAEPGRHRVAVAGGSDAEDRNFDLRAGERLQLQHEINIGNDALRIINAREAQTFADECAYHVVTEHPPDEQVPSPTRVARAQAK